MASKHLVDPDLLEATGLLPAFVLTKEGLPAIRQALLEMLGSPGPADDSVVLTRRSIPGPTGAPPVELYIYKPANARGPLPAIFHIHGGGHIMGSPMISDTRNRFMVQAVDAVVVSVDYRLAPEHPFPAALDDVHAALVWVNANATELAIDPKRIAIAGESAGGGLAASLAQLTRDKGEIPIVLQLLSYPMLDNRTGSTVDPGPYTGEFVWTGEQNVFGWKALLGEEDADNESRPYAVPGRCADLTNLPPTYIVVGALDLFVDEDIDYARRLLRAGVPTELHLYPGAYHGFDLVPTAWATQDLLRSQAAALRRALHPVAPAG